MSQNLADDLEADRNAGRLASDDPRLFRGQLFSIIADGGFVLGGILGLLSVYYFLRDPLPDSEGTVLEARDWALLPNLGPTEAGAQLRWSF